MEEKSIDSVEQQKLEYIIRAKRSIDEYLRAKTWVEKSIERMNAPDRIAKNAMWKALAEASKTD